MVDINISDDIKENMDTMIDQLDDVDDYSELIWSLIMFANIDQKAKYTDSSMAYV